VNDEAPRIDRMPATELAARISRKELSPVEVTEAALAQIDRLDPVLHTFCTPTPELALEQARRLADDLAHGRPVGPSAGVPVAVKDLIATKGIWTAMGAPAYRDFVPDEDDVAVERLKAPGLPDGAQPLEPGAHARRLQRGIRRRRRDRDGAGRPWAATAAVRCGFPRRTAASTGSKDRWDGSRFVPAAMTNAFRGIELGEPRTPRPDDQNGRRRRADA
jgi:Amidase